MKELQNKDTTEAEIRRIEALAKAYHVGCRDCICGMPNTPCLNDRACTTRNTAIKYFIFGFLAARENENV